MRLLVKTTISLIAVWLLTCLSAPAQRAVFLAQNVTAAAGGGSGPTFVQACQNDFNVGSATDLTCTFGSGITSGNHTVFYTFWSPSSSPSPATGDVSDPSSDTLTYVNSVYDAPDFSASAIYAGATVTAGTTVFTFKCSARTATLKCGGSEVVIGFEIHGGSGVSDGSQTINQATGSVSTNADTCTSFTPATNGDLVVFGATDAASGNTTFTAGTSPLTFTVPTNGRTTNLLSAFEYGTQTTAAAINPAFTGNTTHHYIGVCMAVK